MRGVLEIPTPRWNTIQAHKPAIEFPEIVPPRVSGTCLNFAICNTRASTQECPAGLTVA